MELNIVRVGNNFINLSTLLWADVKTSSTTNKRTVYLYYGSKANGQDCFLQINHPESEKIVHYLESNSLDLRFSNVG